ncbi:neurotransmitter-gated ion-channel ligand binding domain-containing protein [Ditylenchus destructor]|uniref:Neurotransmitter-gated ion-channel ligand binding domain-containing protein n=1 Tax=Ditylenchus destructor TaxID=166010 RepID=A0AAD4NAI6_9BILA|nr:neurotransmitter-gated ion-channel ligand binding domain-containing protein [Ditylenchus destructor]
MVVKSVLPNLINVAQIVNIFSNSTQQGGNDYILNPDITSIPVLNANVNAGAWPEECNLDTISVHSQRIINRVLFDPNYDKHLTPDPKGVTVSIELALQTFYDISESSASFTADVLMSQIWHDRRLKFSHLTNCVENLTLSSAITDKIWQPFVCFVNSKKSELHTSPSPNTFVLIYPNGTVWVNYRLRIEGPCYVNLELYPFNEEECELVLESYAYNAANVRLKWREWDPVLQYPSRTKLPDFVLSEIKWAKHSFIYAAGKWDQLTVSFFLTRQFGVYIVQMYFPVETAVFMSWIPFFLDHRSLPARITLAVSALMSITFQYGNILKSLPRVSYIMSVDVWETSSSIREEAQNYGTFFREEESPEPPQNTMQNGRNEHRLSVNFGALSEFTNKSLEASHKRPKATSVNFNYRIFQAKFVYRKIRDKWKDPLYWDETARVYFPVSFLIFNVAYWSYYVGYHKLLKPFLFPISYSSQGA